jgi:D-beta-D-heptose 7-phosphate kinase/D-beta-D-heptose 1-phosphate adenosyltransferase
MVIPLQLLNNFPDKTILVIGDAILDSYLNGSSNRLCREAPVPIVDVLGETRYPGGAANTAVNVAAMGAKCLLFSLVGTDEEGNDLLRLLNNKGVNTDNVLRGSGRRTLFKQRIISDNQMLTRLDQGTTHAPAAEAEIGLLLNCLERCYQEHLDAVIISDYGYGAIAPSILGKLEELHRFFDYPLIVDAKDLTKYKALNITAATPNYAEAISLLGEPRPPETGDRKRQILNCGSTLLPKLNSKIVVTTLDQDGAVIFEDGALPIHIPTVPCKGSVGGAGDTFIAAFTLALCAGASASLATQIGVKAATVAVALPGTATCSHDRLYRILQNELNTKFLPRCELSSVLEEHRQKGERIVFTNGCFDLLHHGHVQHLREAAAQGDLLVVGVNSDESVKKLKGDSRPINPLSDRIAMLSALPYVDFVTPFTEENATELIKQVRPDVFVKGGDYTRETLPEAPVVEELGGKVVILPLHAGYSTTNLIQKINHEYVAQR